MSATEFTRELNRHRVDYELIAHPHTESAVEEALAVGLAEVGKTIVVSTKGGFVRAVLPAPQRLDLHKLRTALGVHEARLATEGELADLYPMFELGAVPPFGGPSTDRTIIDRQLARRDSVVLDAGSHERSVRLKTRDLLRLSEALIADICQQ